ncbi:glycosyltransferase [Ectopseudomonas toyotomiensis]|uniref:glycosyltransferase n=1 Tax=Ectopseudomonas toyotomiensis TaxID=554344 RepID=UPI0037C95505
MNDKKNAVVFGLTADHAFAVACVMMDLKRLSPRLADDVIIIHDGITAKDKKLLSSILSVRFVEYEFPFNESDRVLTSSAVKRFTKMVFTKFECLRLLGEYKNVVWLDYDIVVQKNLDDLLAPSKVGVKMMPTGVNVREQLYSDVQEYDMNAEGMSAGTFVFQDNLKGFSEMYKFCYKKLDEYVELLYLPEQAIFDFMLQEFRVKVEPMDRRVFAPHPTDSIYAKDAKIIHAYGQPKFWNGLHNEQWEGNYAAWVAMGGSPYVGQNIFQKIKKKIKRLIQ